MKLPAILAVCLVASSLHAQPESRWPIATPFNELASRIVNGAATAGDRTEFKKLAAALKESGRGPWWDRVRVAESKDGLNFTDLNITVLEKASVPEAVVDRDGGVWLFFVDGDLDNWVARVEAGGPFKTGLMSLGAAKSADGIHFERVEMDIAGVNAGKNVDPDIVAASDGMFHLYYLGVPANELAADTADPARAPGPHKFYLATSRDLVHWEQQGVAWTGPHGGADPAVYRDAKRWFILGGGAGASVDGGKTFTQIPMRTGPWGQPDVIAVDGGFRVFYSTLNGIRSAFSTDGVNWQEEEGVRARGGADPSVVRMKDSSWRMYYKVGGPQLARNEPRPARREGQVRAEFRDSRYAVAPVGRSGLFVTGQDADLMLGGIGFDKSGGPLLFNHPTGIASDGKRFLVADRWNNRVLIWNTLPAKNSPPDLVLGQKDFTANHPGTGKNEFNWPGNVSVSPDGTKLAVADTDNDRILLWQKFPGTNAAPADIAIDLPRLAAQGRQRLGWPWGVWTDGSRLAAVATHGASILVWNSLPTRDQQPPDLVITPRDAGTPRNITSDGTFLIVGDHNNRERGGPASMVWRNWPTTPTQEPDFTWGEWLKGTRAPDGKLVLGSLARVFVWNSFPRDASVDADVVLRPGSYRNGDGPDAVFAGGRLYINNYNGNNVLVWNRMPVSDDEPPDFSIGSDTPGQDTLADHGFIGNPMPATDGKSLFVSSDFGGKLYVWRKLPDESGARADLTISLPAAPWDNALHGQTLVLAGKQSVFVWHKLPINGEAPDLTLEGRVGSVELREITGVALDDKHFYLSDRQADKIYVWDGIPRRDSEPKFTLAMQRPGRLSSDGQYLAAAPFEGANINIWRVSDLNAAPARLGGQGKFNLPGKCLVAHGHLFVADTSFNRVHAWQRIEDALAGKPADALLGAKDDQDRNQEIGRDKLFGPAGLAFDGSYLWVGEFKFSTRVLRFSPKASP